MAQEGRVSCMISVSGMITVFDYVAALLALVTSECPEGANIKAGDGRSWVASMVRTLLLLTRSLES